MAKVPSNIILIGMPGSGKSTVGVILARLTLRNFIDTDVLIQISQRHTLQDIVDTEGYMKLREIEEKEILALTCNNHVVATGGSAAYSHKAMTHLKSDGTIFFLKVYLPTLESRIHDFDTRGLAKRSDQSFAALFEERYTLYKKYADITIECSAFSQEEVCETIINRLKIKRLINNSKKKILV